MSQAGTLASGSQTSASDMSMTDPYLSYGNNDHQVIADTAPSNAAVKVDKNASTQMVQYSMSSISRDSQYLNVLKVLWY